MLEAKRISLEDGFRQIELEWNQLLEKSKSQSPFLTWEWVNIWWQMLKNKNEDLFIISVTRNTCELIAIVPFLIKSETSFGINFNIVEFIGADYRTSADFLDLIVAPELIDDVTKCLLNYFSTEENSNWDVINMSGISKESAAFKLSQYINNEGYKVSEELIGICPYINLPQTWEEYLSTLSKKSRYNVGKKRRNLNDAYGNQFYIINDEKALEAAMENTIQLHRKRMQMKEIAGFSITNNFWNFHLELAKCFFRKKWLFLGILEVNGSPAASQYGFKFDNKIFHYQTGFDPAYRKYSLGLISTGHMIESAIYHGLKEYDFLRGKEDYKYHWSNHEREIFSVNVVNNNYKGRLFLAKLEVLKKAKYWAKRLLG